MNRKNPLAYVVVFGAIAILVAGGAQSQSPPFRNYVGLQSSTPGTSQSGHANLSGTIRAGQFVGDGAGLSGLNASAISAGTLLDSRLSSNVALRGSSNSFFSRNYFMTDFVGVGRNVPLNGSELFGIGDNQAGPVGMYVRASNQGRPFYGYSLNGAESAFHYVDGNDGGKWKLSVGGANSMEVDTSGNVGIGTTTDTTRLRVIGSQEAAYFESGSGSTGIASVVNLPSGSAISAWSKATTGFGIGLNALAEGPGSTAVRGSSGRFGEPGPSYGGFFESFSNSSFGVYGRGEEAGGKFEAFTGTGRGLTARGWVGIESFSSAVNGYGVIGRATFSGPSTGVGVYGDADGVGGYGVFSEGRFGATGTKAFRIDHPFDPLNKYLLHYASESPMPQNFYNGNVTTDASGYAWVELPDYFEEINTNFKYQLTVVDDEDADGFVLAKVSKTIRGNRFQIRTSEPNVTVSWEIKADRNDLWVRKAQPRDVEDKVGRDKGRYQHPELYGLPPQNAAK